MIDEEWENNSVLPIDMTSLTLHQKARSNLGDLRWMSKPEGLKCIGYGRFFNGLFDVVDSEVGFGENCVDAERYREFILDLQSHLLKETPDGQITWYRMELCQPNCPKVFKRVELVVTEDLQIDPNTVYGQMVMENAATQIQKTARGHSGRSGVRALLHGKKNVPAEKKPSRGAQVTKAMYKVLKKDFERFDINKNGFLERNEVAKMMEHQTGRMPATEALGKFFSELDKDHNEKIALDEYITNVYGEGWSIVEENK